MDMISKSGGRAVLLVLAFTLTLGLAASSQTTPEKVPVKIDCATATEADLVEAIYDKIKVKYSSQMNHINVRIKQGVTTLEGWVTTKSAKKEIEGFAKKIKCVKKVDNKLQTSAGTGCGPGTKQCGNICIPSDETCNIRVR